MEIEEEKTIFPFKISETKESYIFEINNRKYQIKNESKLDFIPGFYPLFFGLFDNDPKKISKIFLERNSNLPKLCLDIKYEFLSELEYYLISMVRFLESTKKQFSDIENDQCSICLCDLYDNIEAFNIAGFFKNMQSKSENDAIRLSNCNGHYFHLSCLLPYSKGKQFIKCPVCSLIYGTMIGNHFYINLQKKV